MSAEVRRSAAAGRDASARRGSRSHRSRCLRSLPGVWPTIATDALGVAIGTREQRGRLAYVFYSRVEHIALTHLNVPRHIKKDEIYTVIVLAHAMAHEMGHLLLPYGHSSTGLMRADWNAKDLDLALDRRLNFTSEQAELIRGQLLARIAR